MMHWSVSNVSGWWRRSLALWGILSFNKRHHGVLAAWGILDCQNIFQAFFDNFSEYRTPEVSGGCIGFEPSWLQWLRGSEGDMLFIWTFLIGVLYPVQCSSGGTLSKRSFHCRAGCLDEGPYISADWVQRPPWILPIPSWPLLLSCSAFGAWAYESDLRYSHANSYNLPLWSQAWSVCAGWGSKVFG